MQTPKSKVIAKHEGFVRTTQVKTQEEASISDFIEDDSIGSNDEFSMNSQAHDEKETEKHPEQQITII